MKRGTGCKKGDWDPPRTLGVIIFIPTFHLFHHEQKVLWLHRNFFDINIFIKWVL